MTVISSIYYLSLLANYSLLATTVTDVHNYSIFKTIGLRPKLLLFYYEVDLGNGKTQIGCAVVLENVGHIFSNSAEQKIITKSST